MPAAHGAVRSCARAAVGASLAGLGLLGYAFLEASLPVLRRVDVPVLAAGEPPVTLLHLSDLHLTDRTEARVAWVRRLARLRPDVVIDTGDNLSFANGLEPLGRALAPFLGLPGAFVLGDHDYRTTVFKSPTRYLRSHPSPVYKDLDEAHVALPWTKVRDLQASGLSRWPGRTGTAGGMHLYVSAGLGTSPYTPVRVACRPEATLLTLTPVARGS